MNLFIVVTKDKDFIFLFRQLYVILLHIERKTMIVCIAEKPSVARDIADVLGAKNRKEGYIEGNGYQVTWTFGHLCTLKEPHEYTPSWKSWSLSSCP